MSKSMFIDKRANRVTKLIIDFEYVDSSDSGNDIESKIVGSDIIGHLTNLNSMEIRCSGGKNYTINIRHVAQSAYYM